MNLFFFIFLALIAVGCSDSDSPDPIDVVKEPSLQTEDGLIKGISEVVKKGTNYYGVGHLVGKPIKSSTSGLLFKTNEVEINMGAFGGDFIGNTLSASIEDNTVAVEFDQLDRNTLYIFKFEYPHKLNPEIESTNYYIRSWEPLNPNLKFEHKGVESRQEKEGGYSEGIRQGKVIFVERWGLWDIDCSVTILMGGLRSGEENSIIMNTYSEESCAFAEKALRAGAYVTVEYSQDYVEVWDRVTRILHKITLIEESSFWKSQRQISSEP